MKENHYDDPAFFEQYSHFPRSVEGLSAAGEWHELRRMLPDLAGKRVLDLGCGFGWHCKYAAEQGAASVLGTDLSEKMLAGARERNADPRVQYRRMSMEEMDFAPGSFDVVISSLALHYVEDFAPVCRAVCDCLAEGGSFVFSCEHPVFTAEGSQEWCCDGAGNPRHWPVDRYFDEGRRTAHFLGCEVTKYHRTLTSYLNTLLQAGFAIKEVVEPRPDPRLMEVPGMADELRRPMMLLVRAEKGKK
ncbi:class I SAM-dependent methyltransferase [Acetanaerobacterium sp. MSJ-12]|uniref:class I SAM-dependent methyltransferase n=1 Tax=Acetanaerobacterium sp. MSJ-12 TaxID=2841535 RepID=UPI001C0E9955|nr:class I SAM-dependent methyltransferase [Acetanaerobacterium sp. MSJ-12]MBU5418982.1 class I SAM-dependent methyltransferase [Acetanaerobacterium sp. MSJ-12]